jgi:hypothetical protein
VSGDIGRPNHHRGERLVHKVVASSTFTVLPGSIITATTRGLASPGINGGGFSKAHPARRQPSD